MQYQALSYLLDIAQSQPLLIPTEQLKSFEFFEFTQQVKFLEVNLSALRNIIPEMHSVEALWSNLKKECFQSLV
jgi:hypothetical protein